MLTVASISSRKLACPHKGLERGRRSLGGRKDGGSRVRWGKGSMGRTGNWGTGRGRWESWRSRVRGRGREKGRGL